MNWFYIIVAVWLVGLTFVVWWMLYGKVFPRIKYERQSAYNHFKGVYRDLWDHKHHLTALERKNEEDDDAAS